jgi:hypothetical protein
MMKVMAAEFTASNPAARAAARTRASATSSRSRPSAASVASHRCSAPRSNVRNEASGKPNPMNVWVRSRSPA